MLGFHSPSQANTWTPGNFTVIALNHWLWITAMGDNAIASESSKGQWWRNIKNL